MKRQSNHLHFSCHCQSNPLSHLSPPPISSISQSYLKPLTLLLHIVSGWQASSQERRPRGGNGSCMTVWVAEWKAISILCQKGALKAETLATVAKACDISTQIKREIDRREMKSFAKIFSYALLSLVSLSDALKAHYTYRFPSWKSLTVKRPWSILRFNTLLKESRARIWSTTALLTASDCTSNLPPDIDLDVYLLSNLLLYLTW